ncbi:substrate-binding periplasmic protein [Spartinivicinus poritis]|uniref:Transporter substrate-binding domain-containing protein n=1 Tax=Spartinivicinus poritis TaxID=2994640 RepID=A0ABT5U473_9GAMM|nr:transporter substrate-binding domain-containing protein [Spartinivicinus sp. A2-2]MDE1461166.1 transporter substrate-binding domain-containing protein [Spartinivicinus sp. A2-2]
MLRLILLWFVIVATAGFLQQASAQQEFLIVGEEWPPFEFKDGEEVVGIDVDIVTHIFKEMNIPVTFKMLPWKRAWSMVEEGKADAVFSTSFKEKRVPYLIYPKEHMWMSEFVFFNNAANRLSQFEGYKTVVEKDLKVGIINGNSYHPSFWQAFPYQDGSTEYNEDKISQLNKQLKGAVDIKVNFKKLASNRIDVFAADKVIGQFTAKLLGLNKKISFYDVALYSKPYPMPFVKKSKYPNIEKVAMEFEKRLKALKTSGQYQVIMDKWLK